MIASRGSIVGVEAMNLKVRVPRFRKGNRDKGPVKCHITGTVGQPKIAIRDAPLVLQLKDGEKAALTTDDLNLSFSVEESKSGRMLTLAPVTVFNKRKLTSEGGDE